MDRLQADDKNWMDMYEKVLNAVEGFKLQAEIKYIQFSSLW